MIVMRLSKVLGMCKIVPYDTKALESSGGGWFPLDSIQFGFNPEKDKQSQNGASSPGSSPNTSSGSRSQPNARSGGSPQSNGSQQPTGPFSPLSITKQVDLATVNLMQLAMESTMQPTGNEAPIEADIHFIGTVASGDGNMDTFTYLRIHLDVVEVKSWSINGSGNDRPTETLELGFEKAAMCYHWTPDGKQKNLKPQAGWDQKRNEPWNVTTAYFPNFPD